MTTRQKAFMRKLKKSAEYTLLAAIAFAFILPVALLLFRAFGLTGAEERGAFFLDVLQKPRNRKAFAIGLFISFWAAAVSSAASASAGMSLFLGKPRQSDRFLSAIMRVCGLPYCTLAIPLYFLLFHFRLLDSLFITVLFLAAAHIPETIRVYAQFILALPKEQIEQSRMDGAGFGVFFVRILLPQMIPVLTGTFITTFINSWGNFIVPFILLSSSGKLPAALAFFQSFSAGDPALTGYLSAYAVLYWLPAIALYLVLRLGMSRLFVVQRLRN